MTPLYTPPQVKIAAQLELLIHRGTLGEVWTAVQWHNCERAPPAHLQSVNARVEQQIFTDLTFRKERYKQRTSASAWQHSNITAHLQSAFSHHVKNDFYGLFYDRKLENIIYKMVFYDNVPWFTSRSQIFPFIFQLTGQITVHACFSLFRSKTNTKLAFSTNQKQISCSVEGL